MGADVRVAVIGGGLAGLFTAVELTRRNVEVVVVDAAGLPGGIARSVTVDGHLIEPAAGAVTVPHPHLSPILETAGVRVVPATEAATRHVLTAEGLVAVSPSPRALLAPVMGWQAKVRALAELLLRSAPITDDETLATLLRRHFGHEAGAVAGHLMAAGVYAGDPNRLSARAAFPNLVALGEAGSVIAGGLARRRHARRSGVTRPTVHVPEGGMADLADTIGGHLSDRYRPSTPVRALRRSGTRWELGGDTAIVTADHVVVAIGTGQAAALLGGDLATALAASRAAPVAVVALGGAGPDLPPGFGYLKAPGSGGMVVGALFESSYAPHRAPAGHWLVKAIVGGALHPEIDELDDDALIETVTAEVGSALSRSLAPTMTQVVRHHPGIPQYDVGHLAWLATVDRLVAERPGLRLTGWAYRGVGVSHLATDAVRTADAILGQPDSNG